MANDINEVKQILQVGHRPSFFRISVDKTWDGNRLMELSAKNVTIPSLMANVIEVNHMLEKFMLAGNLDYGGNDLVCIFRLAENCQILKDLWTWHYAAIQPDTGTVGLANVYKATSIVALLNPNNKNDSMKFKFKGFWPYTIDAIDLDRDTQDTITEFSVTFKFDKFGQLA